MGGESRRAGWHSPNASKSMPSRPSGAPSERPASSSSSTRPTSPSRTTGSGRTHWPQNGPATTAGQNTGSSGYARTGNRGRGGARTARPARRSMSPSVDSHCETSWPGRSHRIGSGIEPAGGGERHGRRGGAAGQGSTISANSRPFSAISSSASTRPVPPTGANATGRRSAAIERRRSPKGQSASPVQLTLTETAAEQAGRASAPRRSSRPLPATGRIPPQPRAGRWRTCGGAFASAPAAWPGLPRVPPGHRRASGRRFGPELDRSDGTKRPDRRRPPPTAGRRVRPPTRPRQCDRRRRAATVQSLPEIALPSGGERTRESILESVGDLLPDDLSALVEDQVLDAARQAGDQQGARPAGARRRPVSRSASRRAAELRLHCLPAAQLTSR